MHKYNVTVCIPSGKQPNVVPTYVCMYLPRITFFAKASTPLESPAARLPLHSSISCAAVYAR